jgi:hypothetical protein
VKNALVIAARELEEKRFVMYAAVAFAILPFIVGLIPMVNGRSPREAIALFSLVLAANFTVGLAVMTGANFVGRDLSDGRLSFYFSRPVASTSIWFGKLTAGILLVVGCFGFIILPAWMATGKAWTSFWRISLADASVLVLTIALLLFLLAHVIGTFARSRSPLIVADFAAAVVCGLVIYFLILPLGGGLAFDLIQILIIALAIALLVGLVGGGAWQLARGRLDRRRNHRALSQFLWGTMATALLIAAGFVAWVVSVKPSDLTRSVVASHSASGSFVTIAGKTPSRGDYTAAWVMNLDDGRNIRIDARSSWGVQYTRDGRSVFWPLFDRNAELRRFTRGDAKPADTGLTTQGNFIFLSDDGGRIATVNHEILSVYDVAQKRSLVSARMPLARMARGTFLSPDHFRLYAQTQSELKIFELDVPARALRETGSISSATAVLISLDPTGSRMVAHELRSNTVTLNNARTGAVIKTLLQGSNVSSARSLRDGRITIVDAPRNELVLHLFAPDGTPLRDIPLGPGDDTWFAGDDGTRVVLMIESLRQPRALIAVDLNRGVIERRETDVSGWVGSSWWLDVLPPIQPLKEVVYKDIQGHVMTWNPATGAKRRIV